ncbi:hypothetical protein EPN52_00925 [bacterium]|nr:MAG: hypothetical protein EPN52_00925 [bacterium]
MMPASAAVDAALRASQASPCRSKRGVAIWRGDTVLGVGHNRQPGGFRCTGDDACKASCARTAIHAEQAALLSSTGGIRGAEMLHVKTVDGLLVPSGGPSCLECSKLLLEAGIAGMWLYHEDGWRRYDALDFHTATLKHHGLPVVRSVAPGGRV